MATWRLVGVGRVADGDHVPMRAEVLAENRVVRLAYFATLVTAAVSVVSDSKLESHKVDVPEMYQTIEIKYSKFGIDDFDFG